jgi:hypothetical protein
MLQSIAAMATQNARDNGIRRLGDLCTMAQRVGKACERAGSSPPVSAAEFTDRVSILESRLATTDILRCAPVVAEGEDLARATLDSALKAIQMRAAEQRRQEDAVRNTLKAAAMEKAKAVGRADKQLAILLKAAEQRARADARQTAVWSLVLDFAVMGVVIGLIAAVLAIKMSPDSARQGSGLLLALALTFGVPGVVFVFARSQNPGLNDWLRLAADKEFAKEFPKKAEALRGVRNQAVAEADRHYQKAGKDVQEWLASIMASAQLLNAAQERIERLRNHIAL